MLALPGMECSRYSVQDILVCREISSRENYTVRICFFLTPQILSVLFDTSNIISTKSWEASMIEEQRHMEVLFARFLHR